jgi:hypothetical protein
MSSHGYPEEVPGGNELPALLQHPHSAHDAVKIDVVNQGTIDLTGKGQDQHTLLQLQLLQGQAQLEAAVSGIGDHALTQMRGDAFTTEEEAAHLGALGKRGLVDDVLNSSYGVDLSPEVTPDRKKRKMYGEQQQKRQKYDVLKSFFKVFFKEDPQAMVLKDAMYNLYQRKIPPEARIARNAMYRHMWSHFKDKISSFQNNYREYVKGIKMVTMQQVGATSYEGLEKDIELLQSVGVGELFDFEEEELAKQDKPQPGSSSTAFPTISPSQYIDADADGDASLLNFIENLENTARTLLQNLKDLKTKLKKK